MCLLEYLSECVSSQKSAYKVCANEVVDEKGTLSVPLNTGGSYDQYPYDLMRMFTGERFAIVTWPTGRNYGLTSL